MTIFQPSDWLPSVYYYPHSHMISLNNSDWFIPKPQCYFCTIYIWAFQLGVQIEDWAPFSFETPQNLAIKFSFNYKKLATLAMKAYRGEEENKISKKVASSGNWTWDFLWATLMPTWLS